MMHMYLIRCYEKVDGTEEFSIGETYLGELIDESVFNIYKSSTLHEKVEVKIVNNFIELLSFENGRAFLKLEGYNWEVMYTVVPSPNYVEGMTAMPFGVAMTYLNRVNKIFTCL